MRRSTVCCCSLKIASYSGAVKLCSLTPLRSSDRKSGATAPGWTCPTGSQSTPTNPPGFTLVETLASPRAGSGKWCKVANITADNIARTLNIPMYRPALPVGANVFLFAQRYEAGDHSILIAEVEQASARDLQRAA